MSRARARILPRLRAPAGRIGVRLVLVNGLVLLVPVVGLEFARIHERQLLEALERDMKNQAALVRSMVESDLDHGGALDDPGHAEILTAAARSTRTRVRLLDARGEVVADSHENGPPGGPRAAAAAPPRPRRTGIATRCRSASSSRDPRSPNAWPEIADRVEVRAALAGTPAGRTRWRERDPGVFLFVAEPIRDRGQVVGAVYAARSTRPVMVELYRIRAGLIRVLLVAFCVSAALSRSSWRGPSRAPSASSPAPPSGSPPASRTW